MNFIRRKIHLFNVTMGVYALDWWERYLFNTLILLLFWFICYSGSRPLIEFYNHVKSKILFGSNFTSGGGVPS